MPHRLGQATDHDDVFVYPVVLCESWCGGIDGDANRRETELRACALPPQWVDDDGVMPVEAADPWAERRRRGRMRDGADLAIAAFARHDRTTLVTNSPADFTDPDVPTIDWTAGLPG